MNQPIWKRIGPTTKVSGQFRTILTKTFRLPDGSQQRFDTYDKEGVFHAGTIALTEDNKVIVARQFRPGPEMYMDEIPGGTGEGDEEPQQAALRELEEETGYKPASIEYLGQARKDAYMNATWHYFLALGCAPTAAGQHLDERERVEIRFISIAELIENAKAGKLTDAAAVLMAYEKLKKLQKSHP
ncbi:MAG TPA: NUDIX hydrolase [Candidatus Saccharimonadales bacterium]|nr:NUDIX hydrolase [Candidatus Saccharimonadales bacterium]